MGVREEDRTISMADNLPHIIPLRFPKDSKPIAIKAREGLKAEIDSILLVIDKNKGVKVSRNEFILTAIEFYLEHIKGD